VPARIVIDRKKAKEYARHQMNVHQLETAASIETVAKRRAPVRKPNENGRLGGALRESIGTTTWIRGFKIRTRVGSGLRYARVSITGADPHIILPKRRKALVFKWNKARPDLVITRGKWKGYVALRKVHHPGMEGTDWLVTPTVRIATARGYRVVITL
jgi:hypothetical protein